MSLKNLENTTKKLGAVYTRKLKKGQKDPFRLSLQAYSPQVFAQDLGVLKKEIKALKKPQISKDVNGKLRTTMPVLTLSEIECIKLYKDIFNNFRKQQKKLTFNGKRKGSDGVILGDILYNELLTYARSKLGGGEWLIAPCLNLNAADKGVKALFATKIAQLEIANRKKNDGPYRSDDIEESFIAKRLTGFQSGHVPGGPNKGQEYRPGIGLTDYEKTQTGIQLGHGDKGQPTFAYKADEAKKIIQEAKNLDQKDKDRLIQKIVQKEHELGISVEHRESIGLKEGLKKAYKFLLFTGQQTKENVRDQKKEVIKGTEMKNFMVDQILTDHASKIDKTIGSLLLYRLTNLNKGVKNTSKRYVPKRTVKSNEQTRPSKTKYKVKTRRVLNIGSGLQAGAFASKVVKSSKKAKQSKPITTSISTVGSPLHLLAIFNSNLEQAIRENMGGSALHNRTGRFAGSVNVLNIVPVRGTTGTVQYTYQRDPYEIFEGQGGRDPRLLIDKTIREQAAEMALGKFTTQRV
jgi:hypothetical protein